MLIRCLKMKNVKQKRLSSKDFKKLGKALEDKNAPKVEYKRHKTLEGEY